MRIRPHKLIIKNTDKKRQAKDISRENSVELEQELLDDIKAAAWNKDHRLEFISDFINKLRCNYILLKVSVLFYLSQC